jgi:hypothetical protein
VANGSEYIHGGHTDRDDEAAEIEISKESAADGICGGKQKRPRLSLGRRWKQMRNSRSLYMAQSTQRNLGSAEKFPLALRRL